MDNCDIELSDDENDTFTFDLTDWIGVQKILPPNDKIPTPLTNYFAACRDIPNHFTKKNYPNPHETVPEFLNFQLPPQSYGLTTAKTSHCFHQLPDNTDLDMFATQALPPKRLAILDGKKSVRTGVRKVGQQAVSLRTGSTPELTERQRLIREMAAIVKESSDRGVGTGLDRAARWQTSLALQTGNAANAASVAKAGAKERLKKRTAAFKNEGLPSATWNAKIDALHVLKAIDNDIGPQIGAAQTYGFAVTSHHSLGLVLCKVLTVYSKGGGKGGKHGYVDSVDLITAASNLVVQVFQFHFGNRFNDKPQSGSGSLFPHLRCFDIIPSSMFICLLSQQPTVAAGGNGLIVSPQDVELFQSLRKFTPQIALALKTLKKRKKKTGTTVVDVDEASD
ncbi:hypothetical protein BJ165DRAFT_1583501 [Panaeolus papilionaceus]|nr:hypothetical protein BJ165DRAFT_1583501 [Panaeolus papilionaceus]